MRPLSVLLAVSAAAGLGHAETLKPQTLLQNIVTFDNSSLFIKGERLMIFSGEVHPFRLPVPSLWLDIFQKVKALGLNTVSFYLDWALLEGEPGIFRGEGIFDYSAFFEAAKEAGMYLIARPGPYISESPPYGNTSSAACLQPYRCRGVWRRLSRLAPKNQRTLEDCRPRVPRCYRQVSEEPR